ncbi:MAG: hypothetical protein LLF96_11225 [Eubacteriales bacterium]|nr:hypothetical protein [Eubacteriales bacterium]
MDDLLPCLIVVLSTGVVAAFLLLFTFRRQKEACLRMSGYCAEHGWQCEEINQPLQHAFVIHANGWRLTTGVDSSETSSQSGSVDTVVSTRWESLPEKPGDALFWFGTVLAGADTRLAGTFPLFSAWGIGETEGIRAVALDTALANRFLLVARKTPALGDTVAFLSAWLQCWPPEWTLHGRAGTDSVSLLIPGTRMDQPKELDHLIRLGEQWTRRFSIASSGRPPI